MPANTNASHTYEKYGNMSLYWLQKFIEKLSNNLWENVKTCYGCSQVFSVHNVCPSLYFRVYAQFPCPAYSKVHFCEAFLLSLSILFFFIKITLKGLLSTLWRPEQISSWYFEVFKLFYTSVIMSILHCKQWTMCDKFFSYPTQCEAHKIAK